MMLKQFDKTFRADIGRAIARIEDQSHAEVVLIVRERAGAYAQYPLGIGVVWAFLTLSYFRFAPELFDEWLIYAGTVSAFVLSAATVAGIPVVLRLVAGKENMSKATDILARACFQKGGIHHTRDKTGVLILVALLERQVVVIPDRGVELAVPPGEWDRLRQGFNAIFQAKNPPAALLAQLAELETVFGRHIPQVGDDANELPDNLDIDL